MTTVSFIDVDHCGATPLGTALVCGLQVDDSAGPATRVFAAPPYRLRFVVDGVPTLLAGIDPYWDTAVFARVQPAPRCVAPITAAEVQHAAALDDDAARLFWARTCVLQAKAVLHGGTWLISSTIPVLRSQGWHYPVGARGLDDFPPAWLDDQPWRTAWVEQWGHGPELGTGAGAVLALRHVDDTSRLRWWRKCARRGHLPPLFTLFVPLLQKFVVLDGHLRWQAAVDEGVRPTVLALWPTRCAPRMDEAQRAHMRELVDDLRQRTRMTVLDANATAIASHASWWSPQLRAWPLSGGAAAWRDELCAVTSGATSHDLLEALGLR